MEELLQLKMSAETTKIIEHVGPSGDILYKNILIDYKSFNKITLEEILILRLQFLVIQATIQARNT